MSYDVIIVGSSPMALFEALFHDKMGKKVAIFEKSSRIGGAWRAETVWGIRNMEVGCHYILQSDQAYSLLQDWLDLELVPMSMHYLLNPKSKLSDAKKRRVFQNFLVPYRLYQFRAILATSIYSLLKRQKVSWKKLFNQAIALIKNEQVMYPKKGCGGLVETILAKVEESSVDLFLNCEIKEIHIETKQLSYCELMDGKVFSASTIGIGQNVGVDISVNGEPLQLERHTTEWVHVTLRLRGEKKRAFDYLESTSKSEYLLRVADVTRYAEYSAKDELFLCCQLNKQMHETLTSESVLESLKSADLIKVDTTLIDDHVYSYTGSWIPVQTFKKLTTSTPDELNILRTRDLSIGIDQYFHKWKYLWG